MSGSKGRWGAAGVTQQTAQTEPALVLENVQAASVYLYRIPAVDDVELLTLSG